ncbi:glycosyltransferase, partial [bacterium]|nr:glycosyltransferase [bacterium]
SFDVLSGCKKRAPRIFIKLNLEWLYRIIKEPKRLKRFYQYNLKYLFYVIKEIIFP